MPVTSSSFLSSQAAHHINTDFFTDLKIAGLTIHARFHIQYSAIKQTDTLPIYDRYGLGSENISMMMQLTAESWLLTCFTWIYHTVKQNKQITESLIFFKHPFFYTFHENTILLQRWPGKQNVLHWRKTEKTAVSCLLFQ